MNIKNLITLLLLTIATSASANPDIKVFGNHLFTGNFTTGSVNLNNPDYILTTGDTIQVRAWGGVSFDTKETIDKNGNIFLENAGIIHLSDVKNSDLPKVISSSLSSVYNDNVKIYSNLLTNQKINIFVTGRANIPGVYKGSSSDSVLRFIDMANGISPKGSFRNIKVIRSGKNIKSIDLYKFIQNGKLGLFQFHDGDVIHIGDNTNRILVESLDKSIISYEFIKDYLTLTSLLKLHVISSSINKVEIISLDTNFNSVRKKINIATSGKEIRLHGGDKIILLDEKSNTDIKITVTGEHLSDKVHILPKGETLADFMRVVVLSKSSRPGSVKLFRTSLKTQQKSQLKQYSEELTRIALTNLSPTTGASTTAQNNSKSIINFADKIKDIEATGQIVIPSKEYWNDIVLKDGDNLVIPDNSKIISIAGEVSYPNTFAFNSDFSLSKYISLAGGATELANTSKIIIKHENGLIETSSIENSGCLFGCDNNIIQAGDQIMILPLMPFDGMAYASTISKIIYQIAVSASVILRF